MPGNAPDFTSTFTFTGKPALGTTYSLAEATEADANAHFNDHMWDAGKGSGSPAKGTMTVTFTTLDGASSVGNRTIWNTVHGSIDAQMTTAGGTAVTAHATF